MLGICAVPAWGANADDARTVAELDIVYQAAVKSGDTDKMAAIFHKEFILVTGNGAVAGRKDWLKAAACKKIEDLDRTWFQVMPIQNGCERIERCAQSC